MNDNNPLNADNFPPKLVVDTKPQEPAAPAVNPSVPQAPKIETVVEESPAQPQAQPLASPGPVSSPPRPDQENFVGSGFKAAGFRSALNDETPVQDNAAPPVPQEVTQVFGGQEVKKSKAKNIKAKNVIIAVVLVLTLGSLVAGFGKIRTFLTNAQGGCEPENISEANLSANSIEIVFQTSKACQMEVAYGTNKDALLLQVPESMPSLNHRIRLAPLLASTTYYYQIVSEGKKLGTVRSFLTKAPTPTEMPTLAPTQPPLVAPTDQSTYTLSDFQSHFGTENDQFDIDKNGTVNMRDWLLYQKSISTTAETSSESAAETAP